MSRLSLRDWDKVLEYTWSVVQELRDNGYSITIKPYKVYDGRKGLFLQTVDSFGSVYHSIATGIWDTIEDYKRAIDKSIQILKDEY